MAQKQKYYVVWAGHDTGIFDNWPDCEQQVKGFPGARYKSYPTREAALNAFRGDPDEQLGLLRAIASHAPATEVNYDAFPEINQNGIAVDAACAGNPGPVEYRGVHIASRQEVFHIGPLEGGTNNIGEYLALVHALALMQQWKRPDIPIYSDSRTAQAWLRARRSKTTLQPTPQNARLMEILRRADAWVATHEPTNAVIKWDTERWGEIPADFGRK